jgi:hypothetical protein
VVEGVVQVEEGNLEDEKDMDVDGGLLGVVGTREEIGLEVEGEKLKVSGEQHLVALEARGRITGKAEGGGRKPGSFHRLQRVPGEKMDALVVESVKKRCRGSEHEEEFLDSKKRKAAGALVEQQQVLGGTEKVGLVDQSYPAE